ncbi:MAG: hypothetical protein LC109_12355 [Bacteroidia bacterium]|nr:hypothetical protein [Bacteroidia bacterium]
MLKVRSLANLQTVVGNASGPWQHQQTNKKDEKIQALRKIKRGVASTQADAKHHI